MALHHKLCHTLGGSFELAATATGMPEAGTARAVEAALRNPYWNPRAPDRAGIERLIAAAWADHRPDGPSSQPRRPA